MKKTRESAAQDFCNFNRGTTTRPGTLYVLTEDKLPPRRFRTVGLIFGTNEAKNSFAD